MTTMASVVALGFLLGMRHATDGDHVAAHHRLCIATGLLSCGFGLFLAYRIGVTDGLFVEVPQWTPC